MRNFRNCKYCGNLYRKKNGFDKNGKGRRVWKMILGFPIYALLGGLGKITELSKLHPPTFSITFSFHQIIVTLLPLTLFPYHHKILLFSQAIT